MKDSYYLSRAYVEFGPFPEAEMLGFSDRGLLRETDYILGDSSKVGWLHVSEWVAIHRGKTKAPKSAAKAVAAKEPTAKKVPKVDTVPIAVAVKKATKKSK